MKHFNVFFVSFLVLGAVSTVSAAEATYNCKNQAGMLSPSEKEQSVPTVRQWDPDYLIAATNADGSVVKDAEGHVVFNKVGRWFDGGDDTRAVSNQFGCCWLRLSLQKGQDYVFRVTNGVGIVQMMPGDGVKSAFKVRQSGNCTYEYIYAADWAVGDAATVDYYVYVSRGIKTVGTNFDVLFDQKSLDEFIDPDQGTEHNPVVLNMLTDGREDIPTSTERRSALNAFCTTFKADLKAGIDYYFVGTHPSADMGVIVTSIGWADLAQKAGATWNTDEERGCFFIRTAIDYTVEILVMPDRANLATGNVGGGKLAWGVGHEPDPEKEPEVIAEYNYAGALADDDDNDRIADFMLTERIYDNGATNFVATVKLVGAEYAFTDDGYGDTKATNAIRGKVWTSRFDVEKALGSARVSGSLYVDGETGVEEVWFDGLLAPWVDPGEDSFEKYNPATDSAAVMGLTCDAFKDELAGSPALNRLWTWAVKYGVKISEVNTMAFSNTGDPIGLLAETYLLNCDPKTEDLDEIKAKFVITSFDLENGVVVAGEYADGDLYGNGFVQTRSSATVDGEYTATDKPGLPQLFYRAYLVLKPKVD